MIEGYNPGADISLLNVFYLYPKKDEKTGKYSKDSINIIYKDNITNEKKLQVIENPDYEFYMLNDDVTVDHNLLFIEESKTHKVVCPYRDLEKTIAQLTGNEEFYYENIRTGNRYANKQLHTLPNVLFSDTNIEDHYRFRFNNLYKNEIIPISKTYFDIEADTIHMKGDFPELGECPVNAVSVIIDNKVYSLLLRNSDNPLIQEFEDSINPNLFSELKNFVINAVGGIKQATRYKVANLDYEFLLFDEEIQLIQTLFAIINKGKPDFVLAWNMAFDIPYLIERTKNLGYSPEDIICHPDFKYKVARYYVDERNKNEFAERGDFATISSFSVYLDQMIHFASRRKNQSAISSFKLDYIGEVIAKVRKLDYSHITTNIAKLPYLDYKTFVFYNIMDTIVQKCIEAKVGDIDYIYGKCMINNTRYQKGHRQTVYLANRAAKEFYEDDEECLIIGNNNNRNNEKPPKFPGALVGDPTHNSDYAKKKLNGRPVNIVDNSNDFDFKSEYPSEMREFNIAANTQIGLVKIDKKIHNKENRFNYENYSRGGQFLEDLHSHVYIEFCERWLHYAGYEDLMDDVKEYFTIIRMPVKGFNLVNENRLFNAVSFTKVQNLINPIDFTTEEFQKPIEFYIAPPDFSKFR